MFAPHYAAPLRRRLTNAAILRAERRESSEKIAHLDAGADFDLLDVTGTAGWGIAVADGLVGYVDAAALGPAV